MKKVLIMILVGILAAGCSPKAAISLPATQANPPQLSVDEYAVVDDSVDTPDHLEFTQLIPPDVRDKHAMWKYGNPDLLSEAPNKILAPFGYRLQQNPIMSSYSFQLFKGETMVVDGIAYFYLPTVKADGSDVSLLMDARDGGQLWLVNGTIGKWDGGGSMKSPPIYAGDKLVTAYFENNHVIVTANEEKIFSTPAEFMVANPIKSLTSWEGRWVLEVDGKVFIDGQSLNQSFGYSEIFDWHLIQGQPFYFFTKSKDGEVGVSYAGRVLAYTYEKIPHYQCCEPAAFNPGFTEHMTWFYGLRSGKWFYVEMGIYE